MTNDRLGTTIIDALTLCYVAGSPLLHTLREVFSHIEFDKFLFYRTIGKNHRHNFDVMLHGEKVATCCIDRYSASEEEFYLWLRFENYVLYDTQLMLLVLELTELLDLSFNNFTRLDLARDFNYNVSGRIRTLMRNTKLKTIINGKQVKDRKKAIEGLFGTCEISLDKDFPKSLTIKQAKAIKNKSDGMTLGAYNKLNEIEHKSKKNYILEFYNYPKRLHRLEVRLNNEDIRKIAKRRKITTTEEIIFNMEVLDALYMQALQSLIRFTKGRQKLSWDMLFGCNVKYR